eukprot:363455-Chlamydomonas_euryale.AAC.2
MAAPRNSMPPPCALNWHPISPRLPACCVYVCVIVSFVQQLAQEFYTKSGLLALPTAHPSAPHSPHPPHPPHPTHTPHRLHSTGAQGGVSHQQRPARARQCNQRAVRQ